MEQFNFYLSHCLDEFGRHSSYPAESFFFRVDPEEGWVTLDDVDTADNSTIFYYEDSDPLGYEQYYPAFKDLSPEYEEEYYGHTHEYGVLTGQV